jgi:hypothetical protein
MSRFLGIAGALLLGLLLLVPVVAAAEPWDADEHMLFSAGGDITLPAGRHADLLVVVDGTATIEGDAKAVLVINGAADFIGARTDGIVAIRSRVSLDPGSSVAGDVRTVDSTVDAATGSTVAGTVRDIGPELAGASILLGPALFLLYLGFVATAVLAALLLAGLAARQVRDAEALMSREPVTTVLAGLAGLIVILVAGVLAVVTVVGIPLGLGILTAVLPMLFIVGYLVAGIWIGDLIVWRTSPNVVRERPYLAAVVGSLVLAALSILPLVGGIVSFIGFGGLILLMWRTLRRPSGSSAPVPRPVPAPSVG